MVDSWKGCGGTPQCLSASASSFLELPVFAGWLYHLSTQASECPLCAEPVPHQAPWRYKGSRKTAPFLRGARHQLRIRVVAWAKSVFCSQRWRYGFPIPCIGCVTLGSWLIFSEFLLVCKMKLLILALPGCGKSEIRHMWESALKVIKHFTKGKDGMLMLSGMEVRERTLLGNND